MIARPGLLVVAALLGLSQLRHDACGQSPPAPPAASPSTAAPPTANPFATTPSTSTPSATAPAPSAAAPVASAPAVLTRSAEQDLRDHLSAEGIDATLMSRFASGKPLEDSERRPLILTLSAMKRLSASDADRFSVRASGRASFADLFARGRMFTARGRLRSIKSEKLTNDELLRVYPEVDAMAGDDPRRTFYRVELDAEGAEKVTAFALAAPIALLNRQSLDEPGSVTGLYVKYLGAAEGEQPLIAAAHVAWYPDTPLGRLGMDISLFDEVRDYSTDLKFERECLYQLLATMRRADLNTLLDETNREYPVEPLFNRPKEMQGTLVALTGKARRAVEVRVNDADIRARFGIDHFYQVEIFTRDSQNNPIVINLAELPDGFPVGEKISEDVRIPAAFLTGWAYNRDATIEERENNEKAKMQKTPLLIGKSLVLVDYGAGDGSAGWLIGAIFIGVLAAMGIGAWLWSRNQSTARRVRDQLDQPAAGTSLNDLPGEFRSKPDFSNLQPRDGE